MFVKLTNLVIPREYVLDYREIDIDYFKNIEFEDFDWGEVDTSEVEMKIPLERHFLPLSRTWKIGGQPFHPREVQYFAGMAKMFKLAGTNPEICQLESLTTSDQFGILSRDGGRCLFSVEMVDIMAEAEGKEDVYLRSCDVADVDVEGEVNGIRSIGRRHRLDLGLVEAMAFDDEEDADADDEDEEY